MPEWLRLALVIAGKDVRAELRSRTAILSAVVFAALVLVVFNFARDPTALAAVDLAPSVLWVTFALAAMLARDVRLLFVYTRGVSDYFRDPRQFGWSFGAAARDPRVTCHYWRDCDHTFYARFARARLLDALARWFDDAFGAVGETR